jgi:hypothetical protein
MFRARPALAAEVLGGPLHVTVPHFQTAHLSANDLSDVRPTEFRADAVVTLDRNGETALAVIVEVQLRRDVTKRFTWPAYCANLYARLKCPIALLVVCPRATVARWCAAPVVIGNSCLVLTPEVLGPSQIPVVTDVAAARRSPELAVLSAMAHGAQPDPTPIFEALRAALDAIDRQHADDYNDLVFKMLPAAAQKRLEEFMASTTHRYQSDFARRYFSQGEAQGKVGALLTILGDRGVDIPSDIRDRIVNCTDLDQIETWIHRAITADRIEDLDD